jgi:hypothetical protein
MKRDMMIAKEIEGKSTAEGAQRCEQKSTVKGRKILSLIFLMTLLAASGCVTHGSSVPAGTGIGAGAGALLGYGLTGNGLGAAAGAGAGALAGALTGYAIDESRRQRTAPPPQSYQTAAQHPPAPQTYGTQPDPTMGEFFNATPWRLEVFVDDSPSPMFLGPREVLPVILDIGNHQVMATAYVSTRFGERLVGTYNRGIYVDPRSSGWGLRFDETMF